MLLVAPLIMAALAAAPAAHGRGNPQPARARLLASGFNQPLCVSAPANDFDHIFVCEAPGKIRIVDAASGQIAPAPFLDVSAVVDNVNDTGLLGMAFHPAFATNGHFFITYITVRDTVWYWELTRYHADPVTLVVDPESKKVFMSIEHPHYGHSGGWLGFSPINGFLYASVGDGGFGSPDPSNVAQTIVGQLQGKMLRIDVNREGPPDPGLEGRAARSGEPVGVDYAIPPSNPFFDGPGDREIWSYGLRNPWRCSFDRATGDLYIGDVGENTWEEIDMEPASSPGGRNYGWRCMEGAHCSGFGGCNCADPSLVGPMYEYSHFQGHSVTGGYVYRGSAIPAYQGLYLFGDWSFNKFWTFRPVAGSVTEFQDRTSELQNPYAPPISGIAAFGEDAAGELYMASVNTGDLYKIVPASCAPAIDRQPAAVEGVTGRPFSLGVIGAAAVPVQFQWRRGGLPIPNDAHTQGATTPNLTVLNPLEQDSGTYDVVLTTSCGSITSNGVVITVLCAADFNRSGTSTIEDLFQFLAAWIARDPTTDLNGSGSVTIQDFFEFMGVWFAGCA